MLNATFVSRKTLAENLFVATVKPDETVRNFRPGQFAMLGLPKSFPRPDDFPQQRKPESARPLIQRAYSIASSPDCRDLLEFCIAVVPDGELTPRLTLLKPDDRVYTGNKITGNFTLAGVPEEANLVLVATGTGIAPFMSMIRTASTWTSGRRVQLLHGVRFAEDLAYRDEIESLCENRPLSYIPVVSRGGDAWCGEKGHVQRLFSSEVVRLDPARDHVFLCGNPSMIDQTEELLHRGGFATHGAGRHGNLHIERYWNQDTKSARAASEPLASASTEQRI